MRPLTLETSSVVGVLANPSGECEPQLLAIQAWADERGLRVADLGTTDRTQELDEGYGLVIALGGDGTILRALQLAVVHHSPVLGVNFGHVGFLADIDGNALGSALDRIGRGEAQVDERTALVATMQTPEARPIVAFNDFVISRLAGFGTARLHVEVSGERVLDVTGDGLVISSPTGSTAYTVEAGGPAVSPTLDAIVLTPLAAQGSPLRSMVLDGSDTIRIETSARSAPLVVEVDGRKTHDMQTPATVDIRTMAGKARLVRTHPRTFYADLARR
ncbi:MAG TPA: NAD(+)/NADH kinase [Thermoleophilaceae bacterium]|nr:NAD(+)/NADH kinase [Thermoleophilaceae bacterium]